MPNADDIIDPGKVFDDIHRLKDTIHRALAIEDELGQSRKARHLKLSREISAREQADFEALDALLAQLNYEHDLAIWKEKKNYENRKNRLHHAYHASRATLATRLRQEKDTRVAKTQQSIISQRKIHRDALDEAVSSHRGFQEKLLADRQMRDDLRNDLLKAFRSFKPLLESLFLPRPASVPESASPEDLRLAGASDIEDARETLDLAQRLPTARFFRHVPLVLLLAGIAILGFAISGGIRAWWIAGLIGTCVAWLAVFCQARPIALRAANALSHARAKAIAAEKISAAPVAEAQAALDQFEKEQTNGLNHTFHESDAELNARIEKGQRELQQQLLSLPDRAQDLHRKRIERINRRHLAAVAEAKAGAEKKARIRSLSRVTSNHATEAIIEASITKFENTWRTDVIENCRHLSELDRRSLEKFPAWNSENIHRWSPSPDFPKWIRIGRMEVHPARLPANPHFAIPPSVTFAAPLAIGFPSHASLFIDSAGNHAAANAALNSIALRILASLPTGRASFLFIDPIGLGRDFAGLMHLADHSETLIHQRIWTQPAQIEERLAEINEHIEKVIQMFLRNEFADITEYNAQPGTIAEKFHFIVISGFPSGFTDTAAKRLLSIASSGARCGVHLLIQHDSRQPCDEHVLLAELRKNCLNVIFKNGVFEMDNTSVAFDPAPSGELAAALVHRIGRASVDSNRVEVPFSQIRPDEDRIWNFDPSDELRIPIGRSGAKKLQTLALGKGTRQHALVAGKTGSGKSTLFHVIITNLALYCSPAHVEFYLIDFKKGVEFKCYADSKLPHARVVAIESDRQFALRVLQRIDAELKHRGELFRKVGSQDLPSYNRAADKPLPRTLLLIDEFQEFFTEDDSTAQQASLLLDRIVRQGRAFGIHAILGSQTLGGAYTLARATLGQMAVRIALQCNEADAHLIMDEENPAPRLLTRPGEGIYNDQSGSAAANSPFQIVWLPEQEREAVLDRVHRLAIDRGFSATPIVFEGNAPSDIRANPDFLAAQAAHPTARPTSAVAWLGAPNSIKGHTAAVFKRQSASNLLIVSQTAQRALTMLTHAVASLAAQYPADGAEFVILDPSAADENPSGDLSRLAGNLPHPTRIGGPADTAAIFADLAATLESRAADSGRGTPEIFVIVHDLQRFKALRPDDEFKFSYDDTPAATTPAQTLASVLGEGGPVGIHVLASIDGWNNLSRWIPRKLLAEFEMRVLFQMSAADSSNLIDTPEASTLGLHRALLHNDNLGSTEIFRPYSQ
jgi:S-DNA-T family DNA segregation ATPase FtsK/SpoIIIE